MNLSNKKMQVPDRAIACIVFGCLSLYTFHVYGQLMWGPTPSRQLSEQEIEVIGDTCGRLETARKALAIVAFVWCIWSWLKEWWVAAVVATLFTALVLFTAFFIDT